MKLARRFFSFLNPPLARMKSGMMDYIKLSLSPCCHA